MSKSSEELRKMISAMSHSVETAQEASAAAKPKPSAPPAGGGLPTTIVFGSAVCAALGLVGMWSQNMPLAAAGLGGTLLSAILMVFAGRTASVGAAGGRNSDIAVEIIKRRSVEMERDRLRGELEDAHSSIQKVNERLLNLQDEVGRERAQKAEMVGRRDAELKAGFDVEKERLLALIQKEEDAKQALERRLADQEVAWAQKFQEFERHLSEGSLKNLEEGYNQSKAKMAAEYQDRLRAFQKEAADKQAALESSFRAEKAKLLEDLRARDAEIGKLGQEVLAHQEMVGKKVVESSEETARRIDEMRKTFESEKTALLNRIHEQELSYQKRIEQLEEEFAANKVQLLSACEGFLKELEAREESLNRREAAAGGKR